MSTLETNAIGKYSGNNVSVDDALNLKSYSTSARNALTSVAGDIYNSDDSKVQFYMVHLGQDMGASFMDVDYLVIAGGASGASAQPTYGAGGGGGAGGYRASYNSEASGGGGSSETALSIAVGAEFGSYTITVGAGGAARTSINQGEDGNSVFHTVTSVGGGGGGRWGGSLAGRSGGSGGGGGWGTNNNGGAGTTNQGFTGGGGYNSGSGSDRSAGGGGGAGAVGGDGAASNAGDGGTGVASTITGSSITRAGGGGGGGSSSSGGTGGGGAQNVSGTVNTGSGGGGVHNSGTSGAGGSGVVILRYATADATITVGAGLTSSSATDGSDTVVTFTAGTGTVSFA